MSPHLVVVVEDDPLQRDYATSLLTAAGLSVAAFESADAASSFIESRDDVRAVLTDVQMPGALDGFDLAIKLSLSRPDILVLMTSGQDRPSSLLIPTVAFLPKPWRAADVLAILEGSKGA